MSPPYVADITHSLGKDFAAHGYPFAIVDSRRRGDSGGTFRPFVDESLDGYDAVEWLARQPYCNQKVEMGAIRTGYEQWAVAKEAPPHLATIVPAVAAYIGLDFPMRNNIPYAFSLQWLILTGGRSGHDRSFSDAALWSSHWLE